MDAFRSCRAAAVLLTAAAAAAAAVPLIAASISVCCGGSGAGCPRIGNRTFDAVESYAGTPCRHGDDAAAAAATPVRKCCPPDRRYDPEARACVPVADPDAAADAFRRLMLSLDRFRAVTVVGYNYEPPRCDGLSVLVDVSSDEAAAAEADYCLDLRWPSADGWTGLVARACRPRDLHCRGRYTCANKCCMVGKLLVNGTCKKSHAPFLAPVHELNADGAPTPSGHRPLPYYQRLSCRHGRDRLDDGGFALLADGTLYRADVGGRVPATEHCLEYAAPAADGPFALEAYVCYADDGGRDPAAPADRAGSWKYVLIAAGFVPSVVCLALTLAVYAALSSLRNVHGYYVMCYVACLLLSFVCLMVIQWLSDDIGSGLCKFFGYLTLFAFLTTFCWLNVICFDIYWMLRYNNSINKSTSISIRTIIYNIYCWGFSSICITIGFILQHSQNSALQKFAPNIGTIRSCWFSSTDYGSIIFFLLPVSTMLVANLVLFVLTAMHCSRIKSELNKFKRSDSKTQRFQVEKEKFVMSIKLFLVMGIPWLFEILSKIFETDWFIWYILDEINALQGVMIFIIFVAKRKVIMSLRKKMNRTLDNSESTKINTISGSSQSGSAHKSFNDF